MWPNSQFPADLVTFTEETLNGKLHFLCSETIQPIQNFLHTRGRWSFPIKISKVNATKSAVSFYNRWKYKKTRGLQKSFYTEHLWLAAAGLQKTTKKHRFLL